jgi:predicted XRE-type DNA-binding protein
MESSNMTARAQHRGTDNVLADLGLPDAEELTAKTILAKKINDIIENRVLAQSEAAKLLAMPQPKISAIRNYKLRGISLERLMIALTALGQHVEISVRPSNSDAPARIDVAA